MTQNQPKEPVSQTVDDIDAMWSDDDDKKKKKKGKKGAKNASKTETEETPDQQVKNFTLKVSKTIFCVSQPKTESKQKLKKPLRKKKEKNRKNVKPRRKRRKMNQPAPKLHLRLSSLKKVHGNKAKPICIANYFPKNKVQRSNSGCTL